MSDVARKTFIATVVAVAVIVGAFALWHLKVLIALFLLAIVIASAMRPGIEWLHARRIPRAVGLAIHYLGLITVIGFLLWLIVPRALGQIENALGTLPTSSSDVAKAARNSHGVKHEILVAIQHRLEQLPHGAGLIHPAVTYGRTALEILIGIFFVFAVAAYWVFEKAKAQDVVLSLAKRDNRKRIRDTWDLIDAKLGAYVRGMLLMMTFVSTVLSFAFWLDGLPYWLLLGVFAGIVEVVPVVGPLIVLLTVTSVGILIGPAYVLLATPFAAVLATIVDVAVFEKDPAKEDVPAVIFPAKDAETG